jgi:hypothetical protein
VTEQVTRYTRELRAGPSTRVATALANASAEQRQTIAKGLSTLRALLEQPAD